MDALKAGLKKKKCLEELNLWWNENRNDEDSPNERDVLEKLQPYRNLKKLLIGYYGGTRFPDWFADNTILSNITYLQLTSCKYCFLMPSLGLLSSLKLLCIEGLDGIVAIGAEFLGSDSCDVAFGSLEALWLGGMENWEEWDCTNALRAFPRLKKLRRLRNCPKVKENLPQQVASLEELAIEDCPQLVGFVPWVPAIQRLTLRNCGKVQLEYTPSTLKELCFHGPYRIGMLEKIEHTIYNNCLEEVEIGDCPNWEFPLKQHPGSLRRIKIQRSCGSLRNFTLDLFSGASLFNSDILGNNI